MNPKAITDKFLYGFSDPASGEWQDGVCARLFRDSLDGSDNIKWLIFDGTLLSFFNKLKHLEDRFYYNASFLYNDIQFHFIF